MALVMSVLGLCTCSLLAAWYIPPPVPKDTQWPKFKQIADGRVFWDRSAVPIEVTSNDKRVSSIDLARMQCEFDWTCKGFSVWKEVTHYGEGLKDDEKWWTLKCKTPPDPFRTVPGYFVGKQDAKIFLKKD